MAEFKENVLRLYNLKLEIVLNSETLNFIKLQAQLLNTYKYA